MSAYENRGAKVIWRALRGHVEADHKLEVRGMPDSEDLECFRGRALTFGECGYCARNLAPVATFDFTQYISYTKLSWV
jgi:hypothetical protein